MDGRTLKIREVLDHSNFSMTPIISYSTKFSSNFYGPFRNAAESTPMFGDRKQYQLDYRNKSEAIRASIRCAEEGADMLMVKPAMTSIDLIRDIKDKTNLMVGAYQVSGEYAGICLSEEKGLLNMGMIAVVVVDANKDNLDAISSTRVGGKSKKRLAQILDTLNS